MLVERFDRRRHRTAVAAVLGSTAAVAICGSLLIAPAAQASTLGGVTGVLSQTTTAAGSATTTTTTSGSTSGTVGALVTGLTTPVTSTVTGTTGVNLAPTVSAATTPVTTAVDGVLTGVTAPGSTTTTTTTVAPPTTTLGSVLATTTSAVTGTVGALTNTLTSPTSLVDLGGSGSGLVNTGSTSGLVGVSAGSNGVSIGLLSGAVTATVGGTAVTPGTTATTPPTAAPDPVATTTTTPAPAAAAPSNPATSATAGVDTSVTLSSANGGALAALQLSRSVPSVYPVKDGYRDSVRFDVRGLTAGRQAVGVTGTAVLTKAGRTVKSWALAGSTAQLTWNGRVGGAVRTGLYTLTVTARSADGTTRTASTTVQVLSQHLATRTVTATSKVAGTASTAVMPAAVRKALALGAVSVRLRTVATVRGAAALVFAGSGVQRTVPLRSGTRTTAALAVPKAFTTVTIRHAWKPGTRLVSLKAIWTYRTLVR